MGKQRQLSLLSNTAILYLFLKKTVSLWTVDLPILIFTYFKLILLFKKKAVYGAFYNLKSEFYFVSAVLASIIPLCVLDMKVPLLFSVCLKRTRK